MESRSEYLKKWYAKKKLEPGWRKRQNLLAKKRRRKNAEENRKYQRVRWHKKRDEWFQKNGPCAQCGSWERLELDHIDKKNKVSHSIWRWPDKEIQKEVKKCQVLCFFCHRIKTNLERGRSGHGYCYYIKYGCGCKICSWGLRRKQNRERTP